MIHKNLYSNRLKGVEEYDNYDYEIKNSRVVNSFSIFFSKFKGVPVLIQSIKDFCDTKRLFISDLTKNFIIKDYGYDENCLMTDLNSLLTSYNTFNMIDVLDYFEICINNFTIAVEYYSDLRNYNPREIAHYTELRKEFIYSLNEVFAHNNLGYEVLDGVIASKESDFLHIEAVSKPLTLLINEGFNGPLEEFKRAIDNYTHNDYENTVIEACKAYESTMKAILDKLPVKYDKNSSTASALVSLLKANNIFDSFLDDSISKVTNILSSGLPVVRNKKAGHGDGTEVNEVTRSYASYALNLAGTYIVFLIDRYYETLE